MKQAFGIALFLGFLLLTPFAEVSSAEPSPRIAAGVEHTCALTSAGKVLCWGANYVGQLGNGTTKSSSTPVSVRGLSDAIAIAAGEYHTCALTSAGKVWCWGDNGSGQLGNGTWKNSSTPVSVRGLSDAVAMAAGEYHTCALTSYGKVLCWGRNADGQLGNGTTGWPSTPVSVQGLSDAVAIAAGGWHTCALTSAGNLSAVTDTAQAGVMCWGWNWDGQLGNGTEESSSTPVSVRGLSDAIAIAAGDWHTCALTSAGNLSAVTDTAQAGVMCWGYNRYGQLGNGTRKGSSTPVSVKGLSDAVAMAAGEYHTCALTSEGKVLCWGANVAGQLGNGTSRGPETCADVVGNSFACSTTPVSVRGLSDAVAVAAGGWHTCVLTSSGNLSAVTDTAQAGVLCWGDNDFGQLGIGTNRGPEKCEVVGFNHPCSTTPVAVKLGLR